MTSCYLTRTPSGALAPADAETAAFVGALKVGQGLRADVVRVRNMAFHRKLFALFDYCFSVFEERLPPALEYKGERVKASKTRFRKDLTILAGHYEPVYNIKGEVKLEATSLSFANCSEEHAEEIFSDVINAALKHILKGSINGDELRLIVDRLLAFD